MSRFKPMPFFCFSSLEETAKQEKQWRDAERKKDLAILKKEIAAILGRLNKCCISPPTNTYYLWPSESDLSRLDTEGREDLLNSNTFRIAPRHDIEA